MTHQVFTDRIAIDLPYPPERYERAILCSSSFTQELIQFNQLFLDLAALGITIHGQKYLKHTFNHLLYGHLRSDWHHPERVTTTEPVLPKLIKSILNYDRYFGVLIESPMPLNETDLTELLARYKFDRFQQQAFIRAVNPLGELSHLLPREPSVVEDIRRGRF